MIYKKTGIGALILAIASVTTSVEGATPPTNDNDPYISFRLGEEYYSLGGGKVMPPPTSSLTSYSVSANFKAYIGYSCGEFDLQENIKAQFNNIVAGIEGIPDQLMNAFTGAIGSMPMYMLKKASPSLYGLINKKYDDYFKIFDMSYKSCTDIEAEIAANDLDGGYNPYKDFMRISVAESWSRKSKDNKPSDGETIEKVQKDIEKNAAKVGIEWLEGEPYGGQGQKPINFNSDIIVAGYNYRIGRDGFTLKTAPTGDHAKHRVVDVWRSPEDASKWLANVVGSSKISLANPTPETTPGIGVTKEINDLTKTIGNAIYKAVLNSDYKDLTPYMNTMPVNSAVVESLRQMPKSEREVMISKMASEMAVGTVLNKVILAKDLLRSGLYNPDVNASSLSNAAHKHINEVTIPALNGMLDDIQRESTLKSRTYNATALQIIRNNRQSIEASETIPDPTLKVKDPLIDGAVDK